MGSGLAFCFYISDFRSCFMRLYEIFERGKKQDLTPNYQIDLAQWLR